MLINVFFKEKSESHVILQRYEKIQIAQPAESRRLFVGTCRNWKLGLSSRCELNLCQTRLTRQLAFFFVNKVLCNKFDFSFFDQKFATLESLATLKCKLIVPFSNLWTQQDRSVESLESEKWRWKRRWTAKYADDA